MVTGRRAAVAAATVLIAVLTGWLVIRVTSDPPARSGAESRDVFPAARAAPAGGLPAAESGLLPWHLPAPVSREAVVAGNQGTLIMLGGLTPGGTSSTGIVAIATATGATRQIGALSAAVHDAAAGVLGQQALVLGGGSAATVPTVQGFTLPGAAAAAPGPPTAADVGSLPRPRSDPAAAAIGGTLYIVGGYDGHTADAGVLATRDGRTFTTVASLPVPVRYAAVAALGGQVYAFGGEAASGPDAGAPVDVIQAVDPARHTAAVVGRLPEPLAGAAAMTVGGELFVAGGDSPTAQQLTPGAGLTQLSPGQSSTAGGSAESSGPGTFPVPTIWAFDPVSKRLLAAGQLQVPVSHAAAAVSGSTAWIVGGESRGALVDTVQMLRPSRSFGAAGAPGAGSPYFGDRLLVADRGNNRLLVLDDRDQVVWQYPSPQAPPGPWRFYYPDDAFFADHGTVIVSNQEDNQTIVEIAYPSGKTIWSYGHPLQTGSAPGYLHSPDDAYLLPSGQITVADIANCRILVINPDHKIARQIGTDGGCFHNPPTGVGSPNGDTPLADGNLLISEINGSWVSEYTLTGKLVWAAQLPISYPSDPQQVGPGRYLVCDYATPGSMIEFDRAGHILYRYRAASGPGMLNQPSLAAQLPSGVLMANDDFNHRMVAIDPVTSALVWQYGITGRPGTAPGQLNIPDGFDLVLPDGSTPTHPGSG